MSSGPDRDRGDQGRDDADGNSLARIVQSVLCEQGRNGWAIKPATPWCHARPPGWPRLLQGWKLHISATPLSAPLVLASSARVLVRYGAAFKFASSTDQVVRLVSRRADRSAGGKFITVYPDADEDMLRDLAEELDQATSGLPGPGILSDRRYRPSSLVHYRYGAFTGVRVLGNDGMHEAMLVAPDGSLVKDHRWAWFCPPPWAPPDPFTDAGAVQARPGRSAGPVLLAGRYAVWEAVRHSFSGSVLRAQDRFTGRPVIIKQARPHAGADRTGRDARDVLRHEAEILRRLVPTGTVAEVVELFEQQGDLFLVLAQIDGATLREWVPAHLLPAAATRWGPDPAAARKIARGLVDLMDLVHQHGLVLRDFNPNNVMVTAGCRLRLVDLEMLTPAGQLAPAGFTPGYVAPEQVAGDAADPAADRYSLGATLFYLASGADPVLPADGPGKRACHDRLGAWLSGLPQGNEMADWLAPAILRLMDEDPALRPDLPAVRDALAAPPDALAAPPDASWVAAGRFASATFRGADLDRAITDGLDYLVDSADPANTARLWPTSDRAADSDPFAVHHGAAGILATLVRAQRYQEQPRLAECIALAANWIRRRIRSVPRILPGLHFGHAGTAWALLDAGQLLQDQRLVDLAEELASRLPLRWPNQDICHGTAGAGLAQLRFLEVTGRAVYLDQAVQAANSVASAAQRVDDALTWPVPQDFPSRLAGARHLGFAHGVAGIGTFLLAVGRATGADQYLGLARKAAATLAAAAQRDGAAAYWPTEPGGHRRTHWCSGSSGVGTFLLRAWQHTGEHQFMELAVQAAAAVHVSRWRASSCQCHGLAGDAEFLLDLAQAPHLRRYQEWAEELAGCIYARHAVRHGRMLAPDETGMAIVPDYGVGLGGVLAFLLRLRDGGPRMWLPESPMREQPEPPWSPAVHLAGANRVPATPADFAAQPTEGGDIYGDRHQRPADLAGNDDRCR